MSERHSATILVVAKAPEPGRAKTRLTPPATREEAARIAAASMLDTVDAAVNTPGAQTVVALTGELSNAARCHEISGALSNTITIDQRGSGLAERLIAAHADTGGLFPGVPILQIGMDTPQVDPDLLMAGCCQLAEASGPDAVLGLATDGGWWALGVRKPKYAEVIRDVLMSQSDTGEWTANALRDAGLWVQLLPVLTDVDTMDDAVRVATYCVGSRFASAVSSVREYREAVL